MNFTECVATVISITGRPDKQAEVEVAVNTVLNLACIKAHFSKDLTEVTTVNSTADQYTGSIDLTVYGNFRKIKYIRPNNLAACLVARQPEGMFSSQQVLRNSYYIAGTNLNWVLGSLASSFAIGYYVYPPRLTDAQPTHWLLTMAPYCIIDLACARIFKAIGDRESAASYDGTGAQLYVTLRNDQEDQILAQAS